MLGVSAIMRDIRQRKRAEESLRESEERLRLALEAGGGGAWYWEPSSQAVSASASYLTLYGFPADMPVTREAWLGVIHPADRERLSREIEQLLIRGGEYDQEFRILHPNFGERWLRGRGRLELDATRNPSRFFGIDLDITERKQAEHALRQQREDLDRAQAVAQTGSWRLDVNRNELKWSTENYRIFGLPEGSTLNYETFMAAVHPDDRKYVDGKWRAGLAGQPYDIEHRIVVDGEVKWVRERASLEFDASGRLLGGFGTTQDITDKKRAEQALRKSEQRYRTLVTATSAISWSCPPSGLQTEPQPEWMRFTGQTAEEMLGAGWSNAIHPDDVEATVASWQDAVARGDRFQSDHRIRRRDGEWRWMSVHAEPIRDEKGDVVEWYGMSVDITDRKRAEEALAQANAGLERKVAERTAALAIEMERREEAQKRLAEAQRLEAAGRLAGGLAHDFNNTLAAIAAHLQYAEPFIADIKVARSVKSALDAVQLGASLNRRLISVAVRQQNSPSIGKIDPPLRTVLSLMARTLGSDITVTADVAPDLWPARFIAGALESAILNLAINARDAMPEGGTLVIQAGNITLAAGALPKAKSAFAGDFVRISVRDSGMGMTPEVKARAGAPFFTTKSGAKGTGLGLSSVNEFVSSAGGFMIIESAVGAGTEVALFLPRAKDDVTTAATAPAPGQSAVPLGDEELVLLIDDDERVLESTHKLMEGLGYAVVNARSGNEALALLRQEPHVRVVVSDVVMPGGLSGFDVRRQVQAEHPSVAVLLVSGYHDESTHGPQGRAFLRKPYTRAEIARALQATIHESCSPLDLTSPANT